MIELKNFTKEELENILEEIEEKANKIARFETDLRKEFFNKLEKEIEELKEKSQYNYIIDFKEVHISYCNEDYFNERKENIILKEIKKYFWYAKISSNYIYTDNFINYFLSQYKDIEIKNNKIKFNINILDNWGDFSPHRLYDFFSFFNTISGVSIPKWDYDFYKQFNEFNNIYILNDNISFKIYKNGKIEIYYNK